jgi:hypothetical protein
MDGVLHISKIKPMFTSILTTGTVYENDVTENGIIVFKKGDLKLYQEVVAIGSSVRDIKVGDKIVFDPSPYLVRKYNPNSIQNDLDNNNKIIKTNFPWVQVDDENGKPQNMLLLNDRDVRFVYEGEEKVESIIVPEKPTIIIN